MSDSTTDSCVTALLSHWISRFGLPDDITSDRGSTFTSHVWTALAQRFGYVAHHTTSYNPEANGMIERFHRSLKAALMSRCTSADWYSQLPWTLLGLRTAPHCDSGYSPAEMVYGDHLQVPAEFFCPGEHNGDVRTLHESVQKFVPCHQTYKDTRPPFVPPDLLTSTHVFLRTEGNKPALTAPYRGPFRVLQRKAKAFLLDLLSRMEWVSVDHLKQ